MRARRCLLGLLLTLSTAHAAQAQDTLGAISELQRDGLLRPAAYMADRDAPASAEPAQESAAPSAARERRHKRHQGARRKRGQSSGVSPAYEQLKRSWHEPWPDEPSAGAPALMLHPVHKPEAPYVLQPQSADGGFGEDQVAIASEAFGSWQGGPRVSQRLLDLIYHAALHFGVQHVHLVSGVRHDRGGSRHSHGLASDIVLPGVSDEELATYCRAQGFVGVGVYTRSGFVHVDVRDRSFFWLDPSPPDKHLKIQAVRAEEAKAADDAALARGQDSFVNPPKLQKALHVREKLKRKHARDARASAE
jgi:hypothetical protein